MELQGQYQEMDYVSLRQFLEELRASNQYETLKKRKLTLRALVRLSPDEIKSLNIPKGPLVRIRNAIQNGLWKKFDSQQQNQTNNGTSIDQSYQQNNLPITSSRSEGSLFGTQDSHSRFDFFFNF